MSWQETPYTFLLVITATLAAMSAWYVWRRRQTPVDKTTLALLVASVVWNLGYALELNSADLPSQVLWVKVQYAGVAAIAPAWLAYMLRYTGRDWWFTRRNALLLSAVPAAAYLLIVSNEAHGLYWTAITPGSANPFSFGTYWRGVGFWLHAAYAYALILLATALLVQMLLRARQVYRWQASALLLITFVFMSVRLLDLLGWRGLGGLSPTPLIFAWAVMIIAWSRLRLQRGDIGPVARAAVIEGMSDGVVVLDAQHRIIDLNPAAARLLNHPAAAVIGQPVAQVWPAWSVLSAGLKDEGGDGQAVVLGQGDRRCICDVRLSPLVDWQGRLLSRVVVLRDVTERRRMESEEREQRTLAEALRDTAAALTSTLEVDDVLARVLENVGRVVPSEAANIMLLEDGMLTMVHTSGYPRDTETIYSAFRVPAEIPTFRQMAETGEPCLIADTARDPHWADYEETVWVRSYVGAPIEVHGQIFGFINLDSSTPGFFTPEHAERLQAFANQAAIALENARLYEALSDSAAEMATLYRATSFLFTPLTLDRLDDLLERIAGTVIKEFGGIDCGVLLVDEAQQMIGWETHVGDFQISRARPLPLDGPGLIPKAVRSGQIGYAPDVATDPDYLPGDKRTRSELVVPLRTAHGVLGVLDLQSPDLDAFDSRARRMLGAFAERVAAAIENMRLYEAVQRHAAELEQRVAGRTAELDREKAQLQAILDSIGEGVIYDEELQVLYINKALSAMTGYGLEEWHGFLDPLKPETMTQVELETLTQTLYDAVAAEGWWQDEVRLCRKGGQEFDAHLTCSEVPGPDGRPLGAVTIIRDVSQEKALQAQRDRFIANASHELRTPLANVKTRLWLARRQPEKLDGHLNIIEDVTDYMRNLVESMLDISRFERGVIPLERKTVNLQNLIADVIEVQRPQAEEKTIRLTSDLPAGPLSAEVDPARLRQVITNLVVNAINYTPEGGQVTATLAAQGAGAVIRVQDTGVGIPPALHNQVFEPFFRASEGGTRGTGLGLSIAREIVELHGGAITLESEVGRGSTFSVWLPLV